jgi:hypothetical protein
MVEEGDVRRPGTEVGLSRNGAANCVKLSTDGSAEAATEKRTDEGGK